MAHLALIDFGGIGPLADVVGPTHKRWRAWSWCGPREVTKIQISLSSSSTSSHPPKLAAIAPHGWLGVLGGVPPVWVRLEVGCAPVPLGWGGGGLIGVAGNGVGVVAIGAGLGELDRR